MGMPENSSGDSSRKENQGPGPAPLKVSKDSHKIRKPPMPPQPALIIYEDTKIIHVKTENFQPLVQRLTGLGSSSSTTTSSDHSSLNFQEKSVGASPAARLASIEKTKTPEGRRTQGNFKDCDMGLVEGLEIESGSIQRTAPFPAGILSPNPNCLPPIPPNFFSPRSDSCPPDFLPGPDSDRTNYLVNSLNTMNPSPSTLSSPQINLPSSNTLDHPSPNFFPLLQDSNFLKFFSDHTLGRIGLHSDSINYLDNSLYTINPTPPTLFSPEINVPYPNTLDHPNLNCFPSIPPDFFPSPPDSNLLNFLPDYSPGLHTDSINYLDNSSNTINPTTSTLFSPQIYMPYPNTLGHPNPHCFPSIPPNFFPSPPDSNPLNFLPDYSPGLHSHSINYLDNSLNTINPSPSTLFSPEINVAYPNTLGHPNYPNCFPSIPPNVFFPSLPDSNPLNFLPDYSPGLHNNNINYLDNSLNTTNHTPSTLFSPQLINMTSPNTLGHPNPNCFPSIPPNFFSSPPDSNPLNFLPGYSTGLHSNNINYLDNSLNTTNLTPTLFSPQINMTSPNTLDHSNNRTDHDFRD